MNRAPPAYAIRMAYLWIFLGGSAVYVLMEWFWRGHSHWTMALTGGVCALLLFGLQRALPHLPRVPLCLLGGLVVTAVEFVAGSIVNLRLGWQVWDYSGMRYQLYGQVSLGYSLLWCALCAPAFPLLDFIYTTAYS